ncbi:MAG: protein-glutamate methylesterase/protein-glutamine glutaminase [Cellvibrionaceae bacterium]
MPYKVLIVDDSSFFQRRLNEIIGEHPELTVVGTAKNGREAIEKSLVLLPDIITMDYEMPVLDGVSAVREIFAKQGLPILMFSSLTSEGARITLEALDAGAVDFIAKDFSEISHNAEAVKKSLQSRILKIVKNYRVRRVLPASRKIIPSEDQKKDTTLQNRFDRSVPDSAAPDLKVSDSVRSASAFDKSSSFTNTPADLLSLGLSTKKERAPQPYCRDKAVSSELRGTIRLLAIGASTGGPAALTDLLKKLPRNFSLPILLIQHMPSNFTEAFAERLNRICHIEVRQAKDGDRLKPGLALLALGGSQMILDPSERGVVRVIPGDNRVNYKPSVDITFASAAKVFGAKSLGIILTGMGSDGCEGARLLKQSGAVIWSQDEKTSVVYGMPMAVAKENLTDCVMPLPMLGTKLAELF